jgi:hypothetical protein
MAAATRRCCHGLRQYRCRRAAPLRRLAACARAPRTAHNARASRGRSCSRRQSIKARPRRHLCWRRAPRTRSHACKGRRLRRYLACCGRYVA